MVSLVLLIVVALLVGLVVFLLMLFQGKSKAARIETQLKLIQDDNARLAPLRDEVEQLKIEKAKADAERRADQEKLTWVTDAEAKLKESFQALAATALKDNSEQLINQTKQAIVEPLKPNLDKLEQHVLAMERKREGAYAQMLTEVGNLSNAYKDLNTTTLKLQEALKSNTARGKWGEIQLRRIVEIAGMVDHIDFNEQETTDSGVRPDMVINLPSGAIIPVDAKVPMRSYLDAIAATDPTESMRLLAQHREAVRGHVKALAKKSYWDQFQDSAEFVVMFIPYESGLEASFAQDPSILDEALSSKVIIVSPSTLLALLKVVAYGWLQLQLAKNAREIADQGRELLDRFGTFIKHFTDLGGRLNGQVDAYNKAVGSLDSRVLPSLRRLKEMGASSEDLPEVKHIENRARLSDAAGDPTDENSLPFDEKE